MRERGGEIGGALGRGLSKKSDASSKRRGVRKKKKIKLVFSPNKGTPWSSTGTVPGSRAGQEAGAEAQELTTW